MTLSTPLHPLYAVVFVFILVIWLHDRRPHGSSSAGYPPVVRVLVPWIGHAIQYTRNPISFLDSCRLHYGPVYKILVGGLHITVVTSTDTIASLFRDTKVLHTGEQNMQISRVIAEVDQDHGYIYEVTDGALFPIIADCLSGSSLQTYTSDFSRYFLQFLEQFSSATTETTLSLFDLMSEGMYQAASLAIFGPLFPVDSHRDFALLDSNIHLLLLHIPFVGRPAMRARQRLLARVSEYIQDGWRSEGEGYIEGASELASGCIRVLKNSNISDANIASTFLTFMWGIHAMSMRSSFWVMAHLLTHENAMKAVREEADKAIATTSGGLHSFLNLPDALDATRLPLLDSAVKETVRHITVMGGLREAMADIEIRGTDQTYVVQKGEYVLTYLRAQNHDESDFPDPHLYKFDRFAGAESEKHFNSLARMSWGGGKHLCKGRHFAQFTLKCAALMCLQLLDMTPVTTSRGESITPKASPRSVGVLRADEEWLVRVRRRRP